MGVDWRILLHEAYGAEFWVDTHLFAPRVQRCAPLC